jgi:hypothetical protein
LVAILEPRATVAARCGRELCSLLAAGAGFDPTASAWQFGTDSAGLVLGLERGLERAGARPAAIDLVAAGASGSRAGDRLLGRSLASLFNAPPPIVAPKSRLGEYGGGFLGAVLLHAAGAPAGRTDGFEAVDPEIGISPHAGERLLPPRQTFALSVAAGGAWAWALLGAPGEPSPRRVV